MNIFCRICWNSRYGYIYIYYISDVFSEMFCSLCAKDNLKLSESFLSKKGLSSHLYLTCSCGHEKKFYTSQTCGNFGFDINRRTVYAMRAIGQGYAGIEKFSVMMNLPKPMSASSYDNIVKFVMKASKSVAEETMNDVAGEIKETSNGEIVNTSISCDSSWQRRGFSSMNGVVTAISMINGKVIDSEPMTRQCRICNSHHDLKLSDPFAYDIWKASHICKLNYAGSAPGMEAEGAKRIFAPSMNNRNLRYTELYDDGDSKSFLSVQNMYPGHTVQKLECMVMSRNGSAPGYEI